MIQNSVGRLSRSSSLTKNQSLVDTPAYQAAADMLVDDADFQEIELSVTTASFLCWAKGEGSTLQRIQSYTAE